MHYDGWTTHVPSRVVDLPPPLLTPQSPWHAVQPSPDRSSILLRSSHECQLLHLRHRGERELMTTPTLTSTDLAWSRAVLPQPHRELTASCWVSGGAELRQAANEEGKRAARLEAVVALGDSASTVSVLRSSESAEDSSNRSRMNANGVHWSQSTIFLHDAHIPLLESVSVPSQCVDAVIPCQYASSSAAGASPFATDVYLICQRRHDAPYVGEAVAQVSSHVTQHTAWMASARRGTAWRVPLTMPAEEGEENADVEGTSNRTAERGKRSNPNRAGFRLFDVRRRLAPVHSDGSANGGNGVGGGSLSGFVFAAATSQHVGLFTTTPTIAPTVYFQLPKALSRRWTSSPLTGKWNASQDTAMLSSSSLFAPQRLTLMPPITEYIVGAGTDNTRGRNLRWCVTSVVEAPPIAVAAEAALSGSTGTSTSNAYSYLTTASAQRTAPLHSSMRGEAVQETEQWWLLYDSRKASEPVWVAAVPTSSPGDLPLHNTAAAEDEKERSSDVVSDVVVEWMCDHTPSAFPSVAPICASYVPFSRLESTTSWKNERDRGEASRAETRAAASASFPGVCVTLDGGTTATPPAPTEDAESDNAGDCARKRARAEEGSIPTEKCRPLATPLVYTLCPPPLWQPSSSSQGRASMRQVRALSYQNHVLNYLCTN